MAIFSLRIQWTEAVVDLTLDFGALEVGVTVVATVIWEGRQEPMPLESVCTRLFAREGTYKIRLQSDSGRNPHAERLHSDQWGSTDLTVELKDGQVFATAVHNSNDSQKVLVGDCTVLRADCLGELSNDLVSQRGRLGD